MRDAGLDRGERVAGASSPSSAPPKPGCAGFGRRPCFVDLLVDRLAACRWKVSAIVSASSARESPVIDRAARCRARGSLGRSLILPYIERLGERRLVALVVAVPAVAEHVDDDVLAERLAEVEGQLGDVDAPPRGPRR